MYVSVSRSTAMDPKCHKHFTPERVPSLESYRQVLLTKIWSPILWRSGLRERDAFLSCKYMALDFDTGELTIAAAKIWCEAQGLSAIIGTSKSHQIEKVSPKGVRKPACDRFRLVIPFASVITSKQTYEYNMRQMMQRLPADSSCVDAARFFYPCKEIVYARVGGDERRALAVEEPEPIDEAQAETRAVETMAEARESGVFPAWVHAALRFGVGEGGRHKVCYRLGANLIHAGFSVDEIVGMCLRSPLSDLGRNDIERAVNNGAARARERHERIFRESNDGKSNAGGDAPAT